MADKVFIVMARLFVTVIQVSSSPVGGVDGTIYTMPAHTLVREGQGVNIEACFHNWAVTDPARVFVIFDGMVVWERVIRRPNEHVCASVRVIRRGCDWVDIYDLSRGVEIGRWGWFRGVRFDLPITIKSIMYQDEDAPQGQVTFDYMTIDFGKMETIGKPKRLSR